MKQRNNLFLIELVVCLFLFAVSAAVCVGLLIHARNISVESDELTQAVYFAQSAAEDWKGGGALPDGDLGDGYTAAFSQHGGSLDIAIHRDGRLIYTLEGVSRLE